MARPPASVSAIAALAAAMACAGKGSSFINLSPTGFDDGGPGSVTCEGGNAPLVLASNYDQSCTDDTSCVVIAEGNACTPCALVCPNATINSGALTRYRSDIAGTPAVANAQICAGRCSAQSTPCCVSGRCHYADGTCNAPVVDDAAADDAAMDDAMDDAATDDAMDDAATDDAMDAVAMDAAVVGDAATDADAQ